MQDRPLRRSRWRAAAILVLASTALFCARATPASDTGAEDASTTAGFANFESTAVHPLRVSNDGTRLFAVHTVGNSLSIFSLADPAHPTLLHEVPVGAEPVSVTERIPGEVWVANLLSDSVSVVDVEAGRVIDTLHVGDEPSDVAFAAGRAFVSVATEDRVAVLDAATRAPIGGVDIPAKDPRALAVDPSGTRVYVASRRSGNGTTILPEDFAPPQPPPTNPALPPAPPVGLIVRADDPAWASQIPYTLPDLDLFAIDAASLSIVEAHAGLGTTHYDVAVHPADGRVLLASTDALNLVRFEPELRGHAVDHLLVEVDPSGASTPLRHDLNPGVDYGLLPNPAALALALAEPTGLAVDAALGRIYVAAHGTDRIGVLDADSGAVLDRFALGSPADSTADRRGPRAVALHPAGPALYVFNRLTDTVSVLDRFGGQVWTELPVASHDPVPAEIRVGRKFLYDALLSGNGTVSCSVCHIDGETDGQAWDLGDPGGEMFTVPEELQQGSTPGETPLFFPDLHPMKGPLVTQPMRGLQPPLHWRGDRLAIEDFNGAFDSLLGGDELSEGDLALFTAWSDSVLHPPNPNQNLDRSLSLLPLTASPQIGFGLFSSSLTGTACIECHTPPTGSNGFVRNFPIGSSQPMKVGQLRDYYRKTGLVSTATGPQKAGFGRFHNGEVGQLSDIPGLLAGLETSGTGTAAHLEAFLMQFDTATAPTIGYQVPVGEETAGSAQLAADRALLEERAALGEIDLVAHGIVDGERRDWLFHVDQALWEPDSAAAEWLASDALVALAAAGAADLVWSGVYPGTGRMLATDADGDGLPDGDELGAPYGSASPAGCEAAPELATNLPASIGQAEHAAVVRQVAPGSVGFVGVSAGSARLTLAGVDVLIDLSSPTLIVAAQADPHGVATARLPVPDDTALAGAPLYLQALWPAGCGAGPSASAGLALQLQP